MRNSRSQNWWLALFIIIVIAGLVFRANQPECYYKLNEYFSFSNHPWFVSGLLVIGILIFLSAYLNNRFIVCVNRFLFPLLLLVCAGLNLQSFSDIDQSDVWRLRRLPTNDLIDLLQASHDKLYARSVYVLFETHFKGRILVSPPGLLEEVGLSPEYLQSWGGLAGVKILEYDSNLTELESSWLLHLEHIKIGIDSGDRFIFFPTSQDSTDPLLMARYDGKIFVVPLSLLPGRGVTQ